MDFEDLKVYEEGIKDKLEHYIDTFKKITTSEPPELRETEINLSKVKKSAK
jgi:hypothetical protein